VDTTLREGEQFASCDFNPEDRLYIAKQLDRLGVDFIELVNPVASDQALKDCIKIAGLSLNAKVLTHIRCHMTDATTAVKSGVHGVNIYMATSPILSQYSHGKGIDKVLSTAQEVIDYVKKHKLEVRFSCEDAFRSNLEDILLIYKKVDELGVDRIGIADTVGIATPDQAFEVVKKVRSVLKPTTGIEFHTHNDTGCCIANAYMALLAGATHIDTCVLGIGERNGITPLGGFLGRMYTLDKEHVKQRFDLNVLMHLERYVSRAAGINIPFNNYITGSCAFTHKAGVHSKAVMANPNAYEVIDPTDFGVIRNIQFAHRLTGWNAIQHRSKQLGLELSDDQVKAATTLLKNLADERNLSLEQVDNVLLELASIPQTASSKLSTFIKDKKDLSPELEAAAQAAALALSVFEKEAARGAINKIQEANEAKIRDQPTGFLKIEGHLFDTHCINQIIDVLVDSPCKFEISGLEVPLKNELTSVVYLKVWSEKKNDLDIALAGLRGLVEKSFKESCTLNQISEKEIPKKKS
jgi:homocitrate synthase